MKFEITLFIRCFLVYNFLINNDQLNFHNIQNDDLDNIYENY